MKVSHNILTLVLLQWSFFLFHMGCFFLKLECWSLFTLIEWQRNFNFRVNQAFKVIPNCYSISFPMKHKRDHVIVTRDLSYTLKNKGSLLALMVLLHP